VFAIALLVGQKILSKDSKTFLVIQSMLILGKHFLLLAVPWQTLRLKIVTKGDFLKFDYISGFIVTLE